MSTRHAYTIMMGLMILCVLLGSDGASGQEPQSAQDTTAQGDSLEAPRPEVIREKIDYKSEGRRDPFQPLFEEKKEEEELPLLQVEEAALVGIMRGPGGGLALVRDADGRTYVLREGEKVKNGYLRRVKSTMVIFNVAKYGRYRKVELELQSEKRAQSFKQGVLETTPRSKLKPTPVVRKEVPKPVQPEPKQPQGVRPAPSNGQYTLQIAAFRQENDAKRLQQWLKERGFETRTETVTIPESGLWYRVRYGMYESHDAVKAMAETLRKRFDFYCWIVPIDS